MHKHSYVGTPNVAEGSHLQFIDVQNLFCEVDKYTRVALPHLSRYALGKKIKQCYQPSLEAMSAWYLPKWRIDSSDIPLGMGTALSNSDSTVAQPSFFDART